MQYEHGIYSACPRGIQCVFQVLMNQHRYFLLLLHKKRERAVINVETQGSQGRISTIKSQVVIELR